MRSYQGYTLVEAVVSVVMIAIATLGGIAYYASADKIQHSAMHKRVAAEIANTKLEFIKKYGYSALPDPANNYIMEYAYINSGTPPPFYAHFGSLPINRTVVVNDIIDGGTGTTEYKEVKVSVSWTEADETTPRIIELATYITP